MLAEILDRVRDDSQILQAGFTLIETEHYVHVWNANAKFKFKCLTSQQTLAETTAHTLKNRKNRKISELLLF